MGHRRHPDNKYSGSPDGRGVRLMNIEEYKKFLELKGNKEEQEALRVVDVILNHYVDYSWANYSRKNAEFYPRFFFKDDKNRIEMDLLIILPHERKRFERKIGVEFKESDAKKVISQAVIRKKYVDYMYIATRNIMFTHEDVIILSYFGIGWVIWGKNFAKIIFPARFHHVGYVDSVVNFIIEEKLKKEAEKLKREIDMKIKEARERLDRWL